VIHARQALRPSFATAPATFTLMGISIAVFLAGMLSPEIHNELLIRFSQFNLAVAAGEWWRIITAAFLHAGLIHILFNMWALYIFGPSLERRVGAVAFSALYLASAAAGGAAAYFLGNPRDVLVGASGAIFGLFGAWLYASYRSRRSPAGSAQFRSLVFLLLINAGLALMIPQISWQGHAGGLVAGFLIAGLWSKLRLSSTPAARALVAGAVGVAAVAVVILV
jgi:membrane associated rhomboid family serine protease